MSKSLKMSTLPTYPNCFNRREGEVVIINLSLNEIATHCVEWFSLDCRK